MFVIVKKKLFKLIGSALIFQNPHTYVIFLKEKNMFHMYVFFDERK